ncbi:MAG TPA: tail fiber protein [Azospirillum sp.]|nr:tail fiber protein [Azospirillum sp.]
MSDNFIGEIRIFAGNYAPMYWAMCNGQSVNLQQNQALFSLIGTTFGGDGVNTFNLPDLRGRVVMGQGQGTGLTNRVLAQTGGTETVTPTEAQTPAHTHTFTVSTSPTPATNTPENTLYGTPAGTTLYIPNNATGLTKVAMEGTAVSSAGGSQPHQNCMPCQVLTYIIALMGTYPTRD